MNTSLKSFVFPVAVVAVAIVTATVIQGRQKEEWPFAPARTERLEEFSKRLDDIPMEVDQWRGEKQETDAKEFKASNCDKAVSCQFRHAGTGDTVNVYLVSGTGRWVTIHTPDQCYRGAGFTIDGDMLPFSLDRIKETAEVDFLTAVFRKEDAIGSQRLQILWGFTDDGRWRGPRQPKPEFGSRPALYKVYIIQQDGGSDSDSLENSAAVAFAEKFLPAINKVLFGPKP